MPDLAAFATLVSSGCGLLAAVLYAREARLRARAELRNALFRNYIRAHPEAALSDMNNEELDSDDGTAENVHEPEDAGPPSMHWLGPGADEQRDDQDGAAREGDPDEVVDGAGASRAGRSGGGR